MDNLSPNVVKISSDILFVSILEIVIAFINGVNII